MIHEEIPQYHRALCFHGDSEDKQCDIPLWVLALLLPDRVSDVSILRDPEQLVRSGDSVQVGVQTIMEVSVCNIFHIISLIITLGRYLPPGFQIFSSIATFRLSWLITKLLALFFNPLKLSLLSRQYWRK